MPRTLARVRREQARHKSLDDVYQRAGGLCHLCGELVERRLATRDHVDPASVPSGTSRWGNIALAHRSCNHKRGNLSVEDFRAFLARRPFIGGNYRWPRELRVELAVAQREAQLQAQDKGEALG